MSYFRLLFTLTFPLSLSSFVIVPASWAQHNSHSHRPSQGAAHDHRFNDIDQALRMFEGAERDTWRKPDEVVSNCNYTLAMLSPILVPALGTLPDALPLRLDHEERRSGLILRPRW